MVHVPKQKRRKWDQKSQKKIFVGYDAETKGFRCIDKDTRKLIVSRDVIFHEDDSNEMIRVDIDADGGPTESKIGNDRAEEATG